MNLPLLPSSKFYKKYKKDLTICFTAPTFLTPDCINLKQNFQCNRYNSSFLMINSNFHFFKKKVTVWNKLKSNKKNLHS